MVASGPEAQRYASGQSDDLVVLDLNRNGLVGLDALAHYSVEETGPADVDGGWREHGGRLRQRPPRRSR